MNRLLSWLALCLFAALLYGALEAVVNLDRVVAFLAK